MKFSKSSGLLENYVHLIRVRVKHLRTVDLTEPEESCIALSPGLYGSSQNLFWSESRILISCFTLDLLMLYRQRLLVLTVCHEAM